MIDLTDKQKALFYTGGNFKDYVFYFPDLDLEITNETIHQEAVTIKEAICEEDELELGGCIASSIEFEVSEIITQDLTGLEFTATLYVNLEDDGTYDLKLPMGVYRVDSAKMVDDKDYKKVVAYDALYDASIDASDWYNMLLPDDDSTTTVKEMRQSLLIYLDIPFVSQNLPNDNVRISKTVRAELGSLPGMMVLKNLCEIAGGFGRINRQGKFEISYLGYFGLFPEDAMGEKENVYPSETLYPEDKFQYIGTSSEMVDCPEYRTTHYEEYWTLPITCLVIQSDEEDEGVTIGADISNPYFLTGNFLLWGKSISELKQIGQGIFKRLEGVYYRPNTTELDGLPYLQTGDAFTLEKRNDDIECYIFSRTLIGVQGLRDTYEAKGNQVRANEVSKSSEMLQLKGKTLKLKKSIDGVSAELADLEKGTSSKFEMTNEKIEAEVKRATQAEGTLSSNITQTAEKITFDVSKTYETKTNAATTKSELSSQIEQTASSITQSVSETYETKTNATATKNELSTQITQTTNSIKTEVSETYETKTNAATTKSQLSSQISQLSNKIELKVTADDVESIIEQNADSIRLKADKISWDSTYSSMSENGILKCNSAELKGTFKCGQDDYYWSKLDEWGRWTGGVGGEEYGLIDFSATMDYLPTGEKMHGIQITGDVLRISTRMISASNTSDSSQMSMAGGDGFLKIITDIWQEGNELKWKWVNILFTNGIMTTDLNADIFD